MCQRVNRVSVFSHAQGLVVAREQYRRHQGSEIAVVERSIATLGSQAVTGMMDAAHAQKTVKTSVEQGNDDVMTVKANRGPCLNDSVSLAATVLP